MGQEAVTTSAAAPANGFASSLHLWELLFFLFSLAPLRWVSLRVLVVENVSLWCKRLSKKNVKKQTNIRRDTKKDKPTEEKDTQKATSHAKLPSPPPSFFQHRRRPPPLPPQLYRFVFIYINKKNTFIQVILEQFFFSFSVFFFFSLYTKNYKKLQKAPLNRPAVTGSRSPPRNALSHISLLGTGASHIAPHGELRWCPPGLRKHERSLSASVPALCCLSVQKFVDWIFFFILFAVFWNETRAVWAHRRLLIAQTYSYLQYPQRIFWERLLKWRFNMLANPYMVTRGATAHSTELSVPVVWEREVLGQ